jgi:translation initiation factor 5A
MIDGYPYKVMETTHIQNGKHGSAKVNVIGLDVLTDKKHTHLFASNDSVIVPTVKKTKYDVIDYNKIDKMICILQPDNINPTIFI